MPSPAVGIELAVGRLRQRQMYRPTFLHRRRSINGGAHKRMTEGHALPDSQQPVRFRINRRNHDPELLGRTQQQQWIADRLGRRKQQQTPRIVGDGAHSVARSSPGSVP